MEFEKFGSLTRFSQGWTITEKLDGSNAQIAILDVSHYQDSPAMARYNGAVAVVDDLAIFAGSRKKWLGLGKQEDNFGFGRWVHNNAEELVKLGEGRHYGEWYGSGIQRRYGLSGGDKRLALFNTHRWSDDAVRPACCEVVHTFILNEYVDNPHAAAEQAMLELKVNGSQHVPGFDNPEGVVMFHGPSQTAFKKTFDYDEKGKWAEKIS